jgi:diguanylate cyclase (GGDEF)-like protein
MTERALEAALDFEAGREPANESTPGPRLLIVDDISDNREILTRRFVRRGFQVREADGGASALEIMEREHFDLVLLDVMMPEIDGLEVLRRIRLTHSASTLPVIMVTARNQSTDIVSALELGANDYVSKPVDFAVALARVNTQIERKRAEAEVKKSNEALRQINEQLETRVHERTAKLVATNEKLKTEIEHREQSEAHSRYLAYHDALTGLGNRLMFRQELENGLAQARRENKSLAVLFVDLDGFKSVNDTLGHSVGDGLLKQIASRLRDELQESDLIARLGGDEFAVLRLSADQPAGAIALAVQIIDAVAAPWSIDGHQLAVGASVGIAVANDGLGDPESLLRSADLAMYRAKAEGRGTYRLFDPQMDAGARARRSLEIELRAAVANGDFKLFYQPLVNLKSKQVSGFEALMRWRHATRGMIPPSDFIPLAEELGLIIPLGEWALRQACAEAATWPGDLKIAVNLSPIQFQRGNLVPSVVNALASSGLDPRRLELEITESVMLGRTDRNLAMLKQLRELGVRISMDDFGTGYSSLSYLRSFQFDKIKIDQSFIRDLSSNEECHAIVSAIVNLGASFGIATTAEGVETEEQLNCLDGKGCTEVQGRLFSMPVPTDEIPQLLKTIGHA